MIEVAPEIQSFYGPKLFCQLGNIWPNSYQMDAFVQKCHYYYTSDQSVYFGNC